MNTIFYLLLLSSILLSDVNEYLNNINERLTKNELLSADSLFLGGVKEYGASAELYNIGADISLKLDRLDDANKYYNKAKNYWKAKIDYLNNHEKT